MLHLSEKLYRARVSAKLNMTEAAQKIGIKRSTYQYWEKEGPPLEKFSLITKAFNLPDNYFFVNNAENAAPAPVVRAESPPTATEDKYTKLLEETLAFLKEQVRADLSTVKSGLGGIAEDITLARATQRASLDYQLLKDTKGDLKKVEEIKEKINMQIYAILTGDETKDNEQISHMKNKS